MAEDVSQTVQRAITEGPFTMRQVAQESGISYDTLYSWANGRRMPRAETLRQLAAGFEARADRILTIAEKLRRVADSMDAG